ncbi:MAG TPA: hypothetical protein VMF58_15900 [Rhizomicrobium sp.]|nr:hypothetical protein [Rhizomicrobium sp.]
MKWAGRFALAVAAAALASAANADGRLTNTSAIRAVTAPPPGSPHTTYYIVVNKKGRRIRGSKGTAVVPQSAGTNIATFPVDVTGCEYVATLGRATTDGGVDETAGFVTVVGASGFSNGVYVQTFGLRGVLRNRPFHLLVAC